MHPVSSDTATSRARSTDVTPGPPLAAPLTPVTTRGRRTRSALLTAARQVFERDGFQDARATDIAEAAGTGHGTFYTYFDSKDDVFRALIHELLEEMRPRPDADPGHVTPYDAIERANRSYVIAFRDYARIMLLWAQVAGHDAALADLLQTQRTEFADRAERSIRRLQQRGLADPTVDAYYTSRALCGMVVEMCTQWFGTGLDFELEPTVHTLTEIWVKAIGLQRDAHSSDTSETP